MSFIRCVFGPKLYMEYGRKGYDKVIYEATGLEKIGDQILSMLNMMWNISYYSSPLFIPFLYRRGYFVVDSISSLIKIGAGIGVVVMLSLIIRGLGRLQSPSYMKLIKAIELSKDISKQDEGKRVLRQFDYDFRYWSVDFDVKSIQSNEKKDNLIQKYKERNFTISSFPSEMVAYLAIHSFGIRMMYPGSTKLFQYFMRSLILSGRTKLIEDERAQRFKIKTLDSNEIDTIFIDNRKKSPNGNTLVICSEGNAGFYEIGIISTPLTLNYSVIGWNHPGFEGSTGTPYPEQERYAIDAVMQFAIYRLGFGVEDILLYGWSIGGYTTLWAASLYPDVKGVILDATFDDVFYLAQNRMPNYLSHIVRVAIRNYCNLNNAELAKNYDGPLRLIRRTEDEIIAEDNNMDSNRGNYLILSILKHRYPHIYQEKQLNFCKQKLSQVLEKTASLHYDDGLCQSLLITYASDQGKKFPLLIGDTYNEDLRQQMAMFLLNKHLNDFKSSHCVPLPTEFFTIPWDIPFEKGYILN